MASGVSFLRRDFSVIFIPTGMPGDPLLLTILKYTRGVFPRRYIGTV
jgi:hypothetical protein